MHLGSKVGLEAEVSRSTFDPTWHKLLAPTRQWHSQRNGGDVEIYIEHLFRGKISFYFSTTGV